MYMYEVHICHLPLGEFTVFMFTSGTFGRSPSKQLFREKACVQLCNQLHLKENVARLIEKAQLTWELFAEVL